MKLRIVLSNIHDMLIAVLTILMVRTLYPMFFQPGPGGEVEVAVLADIMEAGRKGVLVVCTPAIEVPIASLVVYHYCSFRRRGSPFDAQVNEELKKETMIC